MNDRYCNKRIPACYQPVARGRKRILARVVWLLARRAAPPRWPEGFSKLINPVPSPSALGLGF